MASVSESTPLLADSGPQEVGEYGIAQESTDTPSPQARPPYHRIIVVLTHLSAALSVLALVLYLTVGSLDAAGPGGFYLFWNLVVAIRDLAAICILASIASSLNLARLRHARRPLWLWPNLLVDAVVVFFTFIIVPGALAEASAINPDSWLPDRRGVATARAVIVLLIVGLIASLLVGLAHLALLFLRCFAFFQSEPSQGPRTWRVPGGEFRVEFSIKFLRQGDGARRESSDAEA
ncbi:uncharacterized protein DSM5745_05884 [Aspergillus mulundensis]|uniref:MARVEL domain-containing protein n=1 Tax=Aspergillus mulundensis TaxID=1810919 RepID=A0A3D8RYA9_9EURO|nr:hypothetical protein DSM5745_05884 [Aspergillus mulundensis]RDW79032.1 hypothetical protein DSM5745_05884 [Aspergillus mulundensis]